MSDKQPRTAADEAAPGTDPRDRLIVEALSDLANPPMPDDLDDLDAESALEALTDADREALDALGSSSELIQQALARVHEAEPPTHAPGDETLGCNGDATVPRTPGLDVSEATPDIQLLLQHLDTVQSAPRLSWQSSYVKLQELGRGSQGVVYLTKGTDASSNPAMKIYSPRPYASAAEYDEDMQRIRNVASMVSRIHPDNLVGVHQFVCHDGIYIMMMHRIEGYDLAKLLEPRLIEQLRDRVDLPHWKDLDRIVYAPPSKGRLRLQPLLAINIIEKCLRGLEALHKNGIVHGDIKPSNIMLDCYGSIRLIDIGSAFPFATPQRRHFCTSRYAPPEFLQRREWTPKSDLASLGYVLVELLCGLPDVSALEIGDEATTIADRQRDDALLEEKLTLHERLPDLMPEYVKKDEMIMRACAKLIDPDPNKRFVTADEVISKHEDSMWNIRSGLNRMGLAVHEASTIESWINAVKTVDDQP